MKITAKLAYSQLKNNRRRTVWTLLGIILASAMTTAVCGFAVSGDIMLTELEVHKEKYVTTLAGLSIILGLIIAAVAVTVVSNSFRVSADERTAQFGILKSVGATKKQIAATVMYEGLWLCSIGIPVGIALGIAVHFFGIEIANYFLKSMNNLQEISGGAVEFYLKFAVRWRAIAIAALGSFLTVMLSAWIPARKSAKIPAIEAIRGAGAVKVSAKKVRVSKLTQKLFGFEGVLAVKSLKRNKRNFRATVVALSISVMLYIAAGSLGMIGHLATNEIYPNLDLDAFCFYSGAADYDDDGVLLKQYSLEYSEAEDLTARYNSYPNTEAYRVGASVYYTVKLPEDMITRKLRSVLIGDEFYAKLLTVNSKENARLCKAAGVPVGSNILVNSARYRVGENRRRTVFAPFVFKETTLSFAELNTDKTLDITIHGEIGVGEVPEEIMHIMGEVSIFSGELFVIVPEAESMGVDWFIKTNDPNGFIEYAEEIFNEFPQEAGRFYAENVRDAIKAVKDLRNLLLTFVYGFVGMLTLVGLTNVISTISANIRSRRKEFAILRSAGMTDNGLRKMLNLESILSSARALLYGLPLGLLLSGLIYLAAARAVEFPFVFPWAAVLQCVLGVFAVTFFVMRYAAGKLRGGSIVEAIRGE